MGVDVVLMVSYWGGGSLSSFWSFPVANQFLNNDGDIVDSSSWAICYERNC